MIAEPAMQRLLRIAGVLAAGAVILASLLALHGYSTTVPDREELGPRLAAIRFQSVTLDEDAFMPFEIAGAWKVTSDDVRFGGISGAALDGPELVALTDSGIVIRMPKPGAPEAVAQVTELPGGPGDRAFKKNRDSEAITRDPAGLGWWVSFETRNELWLYDRTFSTALRRLAIPAAGLSVNKGIEGMATQGRDLLLLPEKGGRLLKLAGNRWAQVPLDYPAERSSELAALGDRSLLLVERRPIVFGFANALARLDRCATGYCLAWRKQLPVGLWDNVEALAVEPLASGATRLWLMTDDDTRPPLRTLIVALNLPARP
jgi:hypothetical protein